MHDALHYKSTRYTRALCAGCGYACKLNTMYRKEYKNTAIILCKKCALELAKDIQEHYHVCKPGDKAYFVIEDIDETYVSAEEITDVSVKGFFVNGDCELIPYSDIGKTVFLNPEDADAECERLRNSKVEKDYDFEEICPHCDFVNEVVWDGKSRTVVCAGCGKEIILCSACDDMRCGNCRYEKELSKNGGVQDNE